MIIVFLSSLAEYRFGSRVWGDGIRSSVRWVSPEGFLDGTAQGPTVLGLGD